MSYTIKTELQKNLIEYITPIFEMGAEKYGDNNWQQVDGCKSSHKQMHDSMFHHLAESYTGSMADEESGCHPLAHLITRAFMQLYRVKNNLIPIDDQ